MPSLKQVIDEFRNAFQYLDETDHRRSRLYEFWFKSERLKKTFTNEELTAAIEDAVKNCNSNLRNLVSQRGNEDFDTVKTEFFNIIAETLHAVQVKRFVHGSVAIKNFEYAGQSIFERYLVPKEASFFEKELMNSLNALTTKFPELAPLMNTLAQKIADNEQYATVLCRGKTMKHPNGELIYSESEFKLNNTYQNREAREEYATENIAKITL
ncbi:Uncharacterised protein [Legionella lansingensis]|uniref:Uncharacterized protein n=1 Tax=Legionella lansingensis TaxID=45067 RepID=A0A0W0VQ17_9GAMM|nr:hypothetical protein [Legionella lansingensis]KTD22147.1 hypothetical protein Llan_1410 [Legionella lansingensis]SNV54498.1 Uncharacterised protein [Legionella lansingensis]